MTSFGNLSNVRLASQAFFLCLAGIVFSGQTKASPDLTDYELVFGDEFTGSELDSGKWTTRYYWGPYKPINNEEQLYVDIQDLNQDFPYSPFSLSDGVLSITAVPTTPELTAPPQPGSEDPLWSTSSDLIYNEDYDASSRNYLSGIITSAESYHVTHGYFEARLKFPEGQGLWPAFWLLTSKYVESVPEIDIVEFLGHKKNTAHHTLHYFDPTDNWRLYSSPTYETNGDDLTADFHTFGVAWDPTKIRFYVDGVMVREVTDDDFFISTQSMYLLLNLAVGGNWPGSPDESTVFPASFEIDYVRAYERKSIDVITQSVLDEEYQLMFSDEFDGDGLDAQKWNSAFLWGPYLQINNEEQVYIDKLGMHAEHPVNPFEVSAGTLKISAENIDAADLPLKPDTADSIWADYPSYQTATNYGEQDGWSPSYSSGILTSYDSFKFVNGYAEARIKAPIGSGLWPAFWLLNGYYVGPMPEMDIMEAKGEESNITHHSYHYFDGEGQLISSASEYPLTNGGIDAFHVYGFQWDRERIVWYVDGVPVKEITGPEVSQQVSYVLLNLAVGGNFVADVGASSVPAELEVDWVRVWQLDNGSLNQNPVVHDGGQIGASELLTLVQPDGNSWTRFAFEESFTERPIVVSSLLTNNDSGYAVTGVSEVSASSVDVQIDEWDYLDGVHGGENLGLLFLNSGSHDFGGLQAFVGSVSVAGGEWSQVDFDLAFSSQPVVLAQVISDKGSVAATVRIRSVGLNGFGALVQSEELNSLVGEAREVHYIAIEQGDGVYLGKDIRVGLTRTEVDHELYPLDYDGEFVDPVLYAQDQSTHGSDVSSLRLVASRVDGADIFLAEEASRDEEVTHAREAIGWMVIGDKLP